ncbi:MAG: TrmH family RNA methyltransferase [Sulfurovum sp.]
MNFIQVTDTDIPELQIYHQMRENAFREDGSFIADSPKVVNLLLEQDIEVKSIFATQDYYEKYADLIQSREIPVLYVAAKEVMEKIVGHTVHHNVMMHAIRPVPTPLASLGDQIIMLDEISSTQNIGAIARSAAALGVRSYLLPQQGPHPYARRAVRVSMGHIGLMDYHLYEDIFETIRELKTLGYRVYAAEVTEDSTPLSQIDVSEKWVLLMGHEGKGIAKEILDACDEVVTIEMMEGIKSFNVSVAASIMMYRFRH